MVKKNGINAERVVSRTVQAFTRFKPRTWDRDDITQEAWCIILAVLKDRPDISESVLQGIVDREINRQINRQFRSESFEYTSLGDVEDFQTAPGGWIPQAPRRTKGPRRESS